MIRGEHNRKNPWEGGAEVPLAECSIEKSNVGFYLQIYFFLFYKIIFMISLQHPRMDSQILNLPIPKHKVIGSWNNSDLLVPPPCTVRRHKDGVALFRCRGPQPALRTQAGPWTFPLDSSWALDFSWSPTKTSLRGSLFCSVTLCISSGLRMSKERTCGAAFTQSWNPLLSPPHHSKQEFISISFVSWEARKPLSLSPWKISDKSVLC